MTDTICIYALLEPETDEVRYIGQTVDPHYRLVSHMNGRIKGKTQKDRWLCSLQEQGKQPRLIILEEVPEKQRQEAERRWITHYKEAGALLTNVASTHAPTSTTTVRVYPDDAPRLEAIRKALQRLTGDDATTADAVRAAIDAWEK